MLSNDLLAISNHLVHKGINSGNYSGAVCFSEELFDFARIHKMQNIICDVFSKNVSSSLISEYLSEQHRKKTAYLSALNEISILFDKNHVNYVLIKGIVVSQLIYHDPWYRRLGDIDIVVDESMIEYAYSIMLENGYSPLFEDKKNPNKPAYKYGVFFHEVPMSKVFDNQTIYVELKRASSAVSQGFSDWMKYSCTAYVQGIPIRCLDDKCSILHLFANTYSNNESKFIFNGSILRDYFDIAYLLWHEQIDWPALAVLADSLKIKHAVYSVLIAIKHLYGLPRTAETALEGCMHITTCQYALSLYHYGGDFMGECNMGALVQSHRANEAYSLFDRDYNCYQYIKNFKAVLYSKKSKEYQNMSVLKLNTKTEPQKYCGDPFGRMTYQYEHLPNVVQVRIDNISADLMADTIEVGWYDNDITTAILSYSVNIPWHGEEGAFDVKVEESKIFYTSAEYVESIKRHLSTLDSVRVYRSFDHQHTCQSILISIPKSILTKVLDQVAFYVRVKQEREDHSFNMGSIIEINDLRV